MQGNYDHNPFTDEELEDEEEPDLNGDVMSLVTLSTSGMPWRPTLLALQSK